MSHYVRECAEDGMLQCIFFMPEKISNSKKEDLLFEISGNGDAEILR